MPKLLYGSASPYSAKVRMAAAYAGVPVDAVLVDTAQWPAELIKANPLGKIPVLLTDEGEAVFDSRAITQYLNRISGSALFPRSAAKRNDAERLEALADGICDCLLAHVYERRSRPEEWCINPGSTSNGARPWRRSTTSSPRCRSCRASRQPGTWRCAPRSATSI